MQKHTKPVELPLVVSVRVTEHAFETLRSMADTNRRTLSQTIRLLIEAALRDNPSLLR